MTPEHPPIDACVTQRGSVIVLRMRFVLVPLLLVVAVAAIACDAARPVAAPRAESDERPSFALRVGEHTLRGRAAIALIDGRAALIDDAGALLLVDAGRRTKLLDGVREVIDLGDGRVLASRSTDVGESDLWIVRLDRKAPPRALAAAHGADTTPFLLDDGRVLFTSTRTGVASLFIVALDGSGLRQLTNKNAKPGALGDAFVPTPAGAIAQDGARVTYDAGDALWTVDVDTGTATKEGA